MIRTVTILYFGLAVTNALSLAVDWPQVNLYTKPLLMPLLIYFLFIYSKGVITLPRLMVAGALIFSWIGDVVLLKASDPTYFLGGLGAFLVAQVIYTFALYNASFQKIKFSYRPLIPLLLYAGLLLFALIRNAGNMVLPVVVYGLCIVTMASVARLRRWGTNTESYQLAFIGAFLFVISDSILAINKFVIDIPLAGFFVITTYVVAQYLLMKGILKHPV
ncbi:lysoplasmalogenase [Marinoscillum sp. MHG1-6]|uniref:lysoplasmalogenase n=1 Tax=Marinoscillum sp. MHG1-6 TaxID=2959627 RepID=UPI0021586084|nr:lysoplasmalogenase [Marinoscillum sp. MHG1-6]